MSSLQRYKKAGGFVQLLSLLETFGPQKKEKFLEMIDQENSVWGSALREKMLTVERIFSWPDQVVIEIFKSLPIKNLGVALAGLKEEQRARMMVFFSASEKRKMEDAVGPTAPKPEEISSNMVKVVELTRKMLNDGNIRPEKFDDKLMIPEDYEAKLDQGGFGSPAPRMTEVSSEIFATAAAAVESQGSGPAPTLEVAQLQRALAAFAKENKQLKDENRVMREKLEQIKKIA